MADGRHGLPRRGRQGDAAPPHGRAGRRPRGARRALPAERLHDPAGHRDQPLDRGDPPPRRPLSRSDGVPARALPRSDAPDTYTWIPFGGGTRRCLGASFATFEMRVVIARVLERASLASAGPPEKGVRKGVTIVPRAGRARQADAGAAAGVSSRCWQKSRSAAANSGLPPGRLRHLSRARSGNADTASAKPSSVKLRQPTCCANSNGPP